MNRPRISQPQPNKVISARGRIVFSREDKEITERFERRKLFFKTRNKLDVVEQVTPDLISFNLGVARMIQEFKQRKLNYV